MKSLTSWRDIPCLNIDENISRQVYSVPNFQIVRYILRPGAKTEPHTHPEEQLTIVTSGSVRFIVNGKDVELKSGDIIRFAPDEEHCIGEVVGDDVAITLNLYHPPRKEFIRLGKRVSEV